jgi:hypothetical protein
MQGAMLVSVAMTTCERSSKLSSRNISTNPQRLTSSLITRRKNKIMVVLQVVVKANTKATKWLAFKKQKISP